MPTGYTYGVAEGKEGFAEFVWGCARGIGAFMHMRDMSSGAKFHYPPESSYHSEQYAETKKDLAAALLRTEEDWKIEYKQVYAERKKVGTDTRTQWTLQNHRLDGVATQVQQWDIPDPEFEGFKAFMLDQLRISLHDLKHADSTPVTPPTLEEFIKSELDSLGRSLQYHSKHMEDDAKRRKEQIAFIDKLRASIPCPKHLDGFDD